MGYKYDAAAIVAAATDAVLADGLSQLTYGRLSKRTGIADRTIVYYFPTKADLIRATVAAVSSQFQQVLGQAFSETPMSANELFARAWPILATPSTDPITALYLELVGLSASGVAPFDELAPKLVAAWVEWLEPKLDYGDAKQRHRAALAVTATCDGLLVVRQTIGARAANQAAAVVGFSP